MIPTQTAHARAELASYLSCCQENGYEPTDEDVRNILTFVLLLSSSGSSTMCESVEVLPPWAGRMLEAHGHGDHEDVDILAGLGIGKGGHGGGGGHGHGSGPTGVQKYVEYIFKRPRLMGLFRREMVLEFSRLDLFSEEMKLKHRIAELEGRDPEAKVDYPKMTR